jgi:hypothetical protein
MNVCNALFPPLFFFCFVKYPVVQISGLDYINLNGSKRNNNQCKARLKSGNVVQSHYLVP